MTSAALFVWSLRRVRAHLKTWWSIVRLTLDTVTVLYFYLPGLALLMYVTKVYYTGQWIPPLQSNSNAASLLHAIVLLAMIVTSFIVHLVAYGKVTFSLEQGDRLFVMLSPLRRRSLLAAIWLEGAVLHLLAGGFVFAATEPLARALNLAPLAWFAFVLATSLMLNTMRVPTALWLQRRDKWWWGVLRGATAFGAYLPLVVAVAWIWSGRVLAGVLLMGLELVAWLVALTFLGPRRAWDPLFTFRINRVFNRMAKDDVAQVLWRRRAATQWLVRTVERFVLRRPLRPVTWLVMLRSLRQRGVVRLWWYMTFGIMTALNLPDPGPIKVISVVFIAFLFLQWCRSVFRPLYTPLVEEQSLVDPWALKVNAQNLLVTTVLLNVVLWLCLGTGIHILRQSVHIHFPNPYSIPAQSQGAVPGAGATRG